MPKKKHTEQVIEVAKDIASVIETVQESPNKVEDKAEKHLPPPKEIKVAAAKEKPLEAKPAPIEKALTSPKRNIRVKATSSVRGQYRNIRYEIKAGETYTFPEDLANWLIKAGRVF